LKEIQSSGLALLKKTGALIKNAPPVSTYKSMHDAAEITDESSVAMTTEQSESSRPKSQNRRYCIGKLFKQATGVDHAQYKLEQANQRGRELKQNGRMVKSRSPREEGEMAAADADGNVAQTCSLRVRGQSRSRSQEAKRAVK
jgi:hypothetical protein